MWAGDKRWREEEAWEKRGGGGEAEGEKQQIRSLYSSPFSMIPLSFTMVTKAVKAGALACERRRLCDDASRKPKSSDFQGYLTPIQTATKAWLSR